LYFSTGARITHFFKTSLSETKFPTIVTCFTQRNLNLDYYSKIKLLVTGGGCGTKPITERLILEFLGLNEGVTYTKA
jgi:hypothetical protein